MPIGYGGGVPIDMHMGMLVRRRRDAHRDA